VGPTVPALPALSRELADATAECFGLGKDGTLAFDIVGQANHGVCAVATDPWAAYEHVERLDHICEIVLKSGVTGSTHSPKPVAA
jgi:L-fuculose-phosphate aldolase